MRVSLFSAFVVLLTLLSALQADLVAAIAAVDGILAALPTEMLQARGWTHAHALLGLR